MTEQEFRSLQPGDVIEPLPTTDYDGPWQRRVIVSNTGGHTVEVVDAHAVIEATRDHHRWQVVSRVKRTPTFSETSPMSEPERRDGSGEEALHDTPTGLTPKALWLTQRCQALTRAIGTRFHQGIDDQLVDWVSELRDRLAEMVASTAGRDKDQTYDPSVEPKPMRK
jgi:hypothetical protein